MELCVGTQSYSVRLRQIVGDIKIDADDLEKFGKLSCFVLKNHLHYKYYGIKVEGIRTYLHRAILSAPPELVVDHINGDTTDNRKENLRLCTNSDNTKNLRKQINGHTSKYKGVSWYARGKTWEVNVAGHYYGRYFNEDFAASIYNEKATLLFGQYAKLNVINGN